MNTKRFMTLIALLALLLCGPAVFHMQQVHAQQSSSMHPTVSLPEDYHFSEITRHNPGFGMHQSVTGVHYGPLVAFSDTGEAVFVADFFDSRTGPVRGVFTSSGREIAEDEQRVGDITVLQIRTTEPFDLQINRGNEVAWIALIQARACGRTDTCLALFVGDRLAAVTFAGAPTAYALGDSGKITAPAGHYWMTPAAVAARIGNAGKAQSTAADVAVGIAKHFPAVHLPWVTIPTGTKSGPVIVDSGTVQPGVIAGEIAHGVWSAAQGGEVSAVQKTAPFEPMAQLPYCAPPAGGGWPDDWSRNANGAGPIASQRQEYVRAGFISLFHPQVRAWIKKTLYSGDCRPILVAAGEYPGVTQEIWSPAGMVLSYDAGDSVYHLNGVPPVALPPADFPIEAGIRVNRRCQILAVVAFKHASEDEAALVLGTPTKPGHCPVY